jgi:hypothetical protein
VRVAFLSTVEHEPAGVVDRRLPGKKNSNSHGARPVYLNRLDDEVDSDQYVVDNESLSAGLNASTQRTSAVC